MSDLIGKILQRKPYLRLYFSTVPGEPIFSVSRAKNGAAILSCEMPNNLGKMETRHLASRFNPTVEAERTLPERKWKGTEIVLILGAGNPQTPLLTLDRLSENQICILIDAHFTPAHLLCSQVPEFLSFLERPGCHLFCGPSLIGSLWTYLESIPPDRLGGIRVLRHNPSIHLDPEFYSMVELKIKNTIRSKMSDMLTRFEFEKKWIANIIVNTGRLPARAENDPASPALFSRWRGALSGVPAVLAAAGPSLRSSLPLLRELQNRCFILACDTAYKALLKGGVMPHAVIMLDAQKHTLLHFLGESRLKSCLLFADIVSNPAILRRLESRGIIFSTTAKITQMPDGSVEREATPGSVYAEALAGPIGDVQSGGSVATSGFDLLRNLGVSRLFLIGQDLAYTGREIHSTGTHHNERWLCSISRTKSLELINEAVVRKRETFFVPALSGGEVLTDYVLDLYRHWFEDSINRSDITVVNLSNAGANIHGCAERPSERELLNSLPVRDDIANIFAEASSPEYREHEVTRNLRNDLQRLIKDSAGIGEIEQFFEKYEFLRSLRRQTEIYIKRNRTKITEEKARELLGRNTLKSLRFIERSLRANAIS